MGQDKIDVGTSRLSKNITENIGKFQVGNSQAVLSPVHFTSKHVGKFNTIVYQISKLAYFRRRDKTWFDHVTHKKVVDSFGILAVGLLAPFATSYIWDEPSDKTRLFKDIKNRDPVLSVDSIQTLVQEYLASQAVNSLRPFGKGRKVELLIFSMSIGIGNTDAGIDSGSVDVKATTVVTKDFKHRIPPVKK